MSVVVRERERVYEDDDVPYRSEPRTIRTVRRYRVRRPERDTYSDDEDSRYEQIYEAERRFERDRRDTLTASRPYEVDSYSRSTEYISRSAPRSQTIVVRERPEPIVVERPEPIIIRERPEPIVIRERPEPVVIREVVRRPPSPEYVERREVREVREVIRREPSPEPVYVREVEPRDSVSQWSSDDDLVYIHRETTEGGYRSRSPHHRRHLAEGAIAAVGAEELIRHHRKKQGEPDRHHKRNVAGAVVAGALGAEAISRAKEHRSRSGHHRHRHESHHRHESDAARLAKLGLGAAAVAVGVNYAMNRNRDRRSRSQSRDRVRIRRHSISGYDVYDSDGRSRSRSHHRLAEAALGTAAAAGLIHHERSKSRNRSRSHSRSRHSGHRSRSSSSHHHKLPIAAAAIGTAALLHHEKKKHEREEARSRSRSRSRSVTAAYDDPDRPSNRGLIEYGDEPVYANAADYYSRPARDEVVPAAGRAATFPLRERSRSRSRRRYDDSSSDTSSEDSRGYRGGHEHRRKSSPDVGKRLAEVGLAAGAAGLAAHEITKIHDRKKAEEDARRHDGDYYAESGADSRYSASPSRNPAGTAPASAGVAASHQEAYYPNTNNFPPPPTAPNAPAPYNPADYVPRPPEPPFMQPDPHAYGGTERSTAEEQRTDSVSGDFVGVRTPTNGNGAGVGGLPQAAGKTVSFDLDSPSRPKPRRHSSSPPRRRKYDERDTSPTPSTASDTTIGLPPQFDRHGRPLNRGRSRHEGMGKGEEFAFRLGKGVAGLGKVLEDVVFGKR